MLCSEGRCAPGGRPERQRGFVSGPRELSQPVCDARTLCFWLGSVGSGLVTPQSLSDCETCGVSSQESVSTQKFYVSFQTVHGLERVGGPDQGRYGVN